MKTATFRSVLSFAVMAFTACLPEPEIFAAESTDPAKRPRVALVLSGGGALGFAHIGVLKVLEELRVPVDCIVGTSMGALVGGSYCAGVSANDMEKIIIESDIGSLFDDEPPRSEIPHNLKQDDYRPLFDFTLGFNKGELQLPTGASAGYKFELFLKKMIGTGASVANLNFSELPIPYRAIATNLETGEMKVFEQGELSQVMRASMSLPAVVNPTKIGNSVYVDGGLVNNLPIDIGRELCGEVLIAVNLGTKPKSKEEIHNSIDVALQSIVLLTEQNVKQSLEKLTADDILIEPNLKEYSSSSFSNQEEIIERGVVAARKQTARLAALAVSPDTYQHWLAGRQFKEFPSLTVTDITAETSGEVNTKAVTRDITTKPGQEFDRDNLGKDIVDMYGRGDFSYIGYSIIPDEESATIIIDAEAKPWGPGYLKFGFGAATDFTSPTQLNLAMSYRRTWMNSLGAEWRTDAQIGYNSFLRTEFMQPLQVRDGVFITPYLAAQRHFIQYYAEDIRLGDYRVQRLLAGVDLGITGRFGELTIGPYVGQIRGTPDFSILNTILPALDNDRIALLFTGVIDQLDRLVFPRSGYQASVEILNAEDKPYPGDDFSRAQASLTGAVSLGKNTFLARAEWGKEISGQDENIPVYEAFILGGPRRLSGLYLDQLTGTEYDLETLTYYRQYASLPSQLGRGLYVGFSAESGRINDELMKDPWDRVYAGSIFWGADTILGALHIGYGYSSLDQRAWYLVIGPRF